MADNKFNPFNPFANFASMDFSQFDMTKMMQSYQVPGIDMEKMMEAQRRNIEALTTANQVAVEGMQAVARRQAEILSQAMGEISTNAQRLASSANNPQEMTTQQADVAREALEKAFANMRELAEMINKSNTEAFQIINKRFNESLEELRGAMPNTPTSNKK